MNDAQRTILIVDDDADDRLMLSDALGESGINHELHEAENGEELLDYLHNDGKFSDSSKYPQPHLVFLDLNMPKKDGRTALKEVKENPALRHIPIIILTTSKAEEDVLRIYEAGGTSYIQKPSSYEGLVDIIKILGRYWFHIVTLPPNQHA